MLGIGFHPHGAASLFPQPMDELSGQFTPLEDLSLPRSRELNRALELPDPVAAVEAALLSTRNTSREIVSVFNRTKLRRDRKKAMRDKQSIG
jgi:hypothetical protein